MTFDSREQSLDNGRPVRLYEFARGTSRWLYTNAALGVVHNTRTFIATAIDDDGIRQTGEAGADALNIQLPINAPLLDQYRVHRPSTPVSVTVWDKHIGEAEALVAWVGHVSDVTRMAGRKELAKLVCTPLSSDLSTNGLRLTWGRNCPYSVYDENCRVDKEAFRTDAVLDSVSGLTLSAAEFGAHPDDWFADGFLQWDGPDGITEERGIASHTGSAITLLGGALDLASGLAVRAYPGCPRVYSVCDSKFNNSPNYGGVPGMPGKSPFDGDPIF